MTLCSTLRSIAREAIRRHLFVRVTRGRSIEKSLYQLPLPPSLIQFLLFEINEDYRINFQKILRDYVDRKGESGNARKNVS